MSWVLGIAAFVALFAAFGVLNGALERKRDCHECPEERQSPACGTCPLGGNRPPRPEERRAKLTLIRGNGQTTDVS